MQPSRIEEQLIYGVKISLDELNVYVKDLFAEIDEDKKLSQIVINGIVKRIQQCVNVEGKQFEHLKE